MPLLGSGLSRQASSEFPNWRGLLGSFQAYAKEEGFIRAPEAQQIRNLVAHGQYLMAAEHLRSVIPNDAFTSILQDKFDPPDVAPAAVHELVLALQPPIILTTNYDRLVENAYAAHYSKAPTVLTYESASTLQRSMQAGHLSNRPPIIFKLHGSIQDPGGIILSERDYRNLIYRQPGYRMVLSALFLTRVILMIGFSVEDPELLLLLENHREALKYDTSPDYAFLPVRKRDSVRVRRLRDDFGVHVIPYSASAGHPEIRELLEYLVKQANSPAASSAPGAGTPT